MYLGMDSECRLFRQAKLTPRQVEVLALHYFDGLTVRGVARLLGIRPSAAHQHLKRALVKLRRVGLEPHKVAEFSQITMDPHELAELDPKRVRAIW